MKKTFTFFILLCAMLTTTKVWATGGVLTGEGTNANPYIISDVDDWNFFASKLNDGTTVVDYAEKYYKLVADIGPVTMMASTYYNYPFCGNFNGNGHTITVDLTRDTNPGGNDYNQGLALFQFAGNGCNIHDLHVDGTIVTCGKFAAGFIAYISNGNTENYQKIVSISRCRSSVTITSTVEGDATSAGFVGASKKYVNLVLNNCLFDGAFVSSTATQFCGMVGWQDGAGNANVLNSLVKPGAGMNLTAPNGNHYTFCRCGGESFGMINSYYYNAIGTEQGNAVGSMSNDDLKNALGAAWLVQNDAVVPYAISYHYTLIDHYTATDVYTPGNILPDNGSLGYAKFVDGDKDTYWTTCPTDWTPCYINFQSETPFVLKGYVLTMAPNIQSNPNHNPTEWYLRGKNAQGDWEVIDHRGGWQSDGHYQWFSNENLPIMNSAEKVYVLAANTKSYQQFQFEVISVRGWDNNGFKAFSMAEMQLFGLLDNSDIVNACISGVNDVYMYTGSAIDVNCTVHDYNGNLLTKDTDYTQTITNADDEVVATVTAAGSYALTITGTGSYTGTKSVGFTVTDHPTGLSIDSSIPVGTIGHYYIRLPRNQQSVIDLTSMTPAFTTPFKVYDDGGKAKNFTKGCAEDLLVVAPEGYVLQVCGSIDLGDETLLEFYDGTWGENLMAGNFNRCIGDDIGFLITTGPQLAIKYNTSTKTNRAGLDLSVIPVPANTQSNITISNCQHGSVIAKVDGNAVSSARVNSLVTLTATPESGYMPNGFVVTDIEGHNIPVTGGWYTGNTATFTMPGSAVTITPSFVTTAYPTELSVNIPRYSSDPTDALVATIPANVGYFKIYDNGGSSNNYSYSSDGYLLLVAPEGNVIQLTAVTMHDIVPYDNLEVFDGNTTDHPLGGPYSYDDDLGTLTSTGNQMLLHFVCNYTYYNTYAGLNLIARVYDTSTQFAITVTPTEYGTVAVSPASSTSAGSTVTLTFTANEGNTGYRAMNFTTNYPSVTVDGGWYSNNVMTFSMPAGPVTVNPNFTIATTAEYGLYVNMPKKNTYATSRMVNIPEGVSSFKVYDDGGKDGIFSDFCDGYMILTAAEGRRIRLTGTVHSEQGTDYLEVYDGNTTDQLIGRYGYENIGTIYSSGQSLLLHFQSNDWNQFALYEGLNLLVETVTTPSPYITFSGFTATAGQNGYTPSAEGESWTSLVDNTTNTVWRTHNDNGWGFQTCWVEFNHTEPIVPKKYFLMTGNQTKNYPGRLPKSWILKGKLNSTDEWTTIANVEDDEHLLPINNYAVEYSLEENNHAYQYFRFEVSEVQGHEPTTYTWDDYVMELNELYFKGYRATTVQNNLAYATISGVKSRYTYSGTTLALNPVVTNVNGETLTEGTDYLKAIEPATVQNPGDYTLTISAKDGSGYTGNQSLHFKITDYPDNVEVDEDYESPDQLGYYYVNMPKTSAKAVNLADPAGFRKSIKIYDDGGKNGNYSQWCTGTMLLQAPEGYVLQLTGTVTCKPDADYLKVYNGQVSESNILGKAHYGNEEGEDIGTLTTTSRNIWLEFSTNNSSTRSGLNLTLSMISTTETHAVSFDYVVGGTATATPNPASVGSTVALTPNANPGYIIYDYVAKDTYDHDLDVDVNWYGNSTFTMPGSEVTVTPLTTHRLSYLGGLYVNMDWNETKTVNIPQGVSSFKVYDNGGKDGNYHSPCSDMLVLNAPEGYVLRVEGTGDFGSIGANQNFKVYDGNEWTIYGGGNHVVIGPITTVGNQMQMQLHNENSGHSGLDLTVTVYKPNCWGVGTDGSAEHPYEISDMDGLQTLAALSESDSFAGKNFKLTANIGTAANPFRKVIGDNMDYPFSGIFDGNGHTITMALTNENVFDGADEAEQGTALFHYAGSGCDIKNLTIDGTINTANKFAGSLIAYIKPGESGNSKVVALSNCHSRVVITSTHAGDNTTGGFIGLVKEYVHLTLSKCVFDGAFVSAEGTQFSGFVGYIANHVETHINYSVMAADITGLGVQDGGHYTFCRYNNNSVPAFEQVNYYYNALGTVQGTRAYRLTLPYGVTVTRDSAIATGNDEAYVYTNGFNIGECPYYTDDATVTLEPSMTLTITHATVTYGEISWSANPNGDGTFWFNMPASDATVTATLGVQITVTGYGESTASDKWVFLALPAIPEGGSVNPTTIENLITNDASYYDLYRFNQSAEKEWENFKSWSTNGFTTMTHGRGYLYARRYTGSMLFTGTFLATESHQVALSYDANARLKGCNLVGNPFPVAAYANRPYYKMNEFGTDIEVVENYWANSIPACTGVVVIANGTDEHVTFSTTAPEAPVTATGDNGCLQMILTKSEMRGDAFQDKAVVSFNDNMQLSKFVFNEDHAKLYLPKNDKDYAIISSDQQEEIQVNFKTKELGQYTINFDGLDMISGARLIDNVTGNVIDLNIDDEYTFIGAPTDRRDRFVIRFAASDGSETSTAFAYQNGSDIIVNGEGELQMFDVMGRLVMQKRVNGVEKINAEAHGVYILKLNDKVQKIVVR